MTKVLDATATAQKKMGERAKESKKDQPDFSLNDLLLRGRVSGGSTQRELPSGDKVVEFRLVISRDDRAGVDTLDIAAWSSKARRSALGLKSGQWIEVAGAVHRRFWRGPGGLSSRWQVEAIEIVRL